MKMKWTTSFIDNHHHHHNNNNNNDLPFGRYIIFCCFFASFFVSLFCFDQFTKNFSFVFIFIELIWTVFKSPINNRKNSSNFYWKQRNFIPHKPCCYRYNYTKIRYCHRYVIIDLINNNFFKLWNSIFFRLIKFFFAHRYCQNQSIHYEIILNDWKKRKNVNLNNQTFEAMYNKKYRLYNIDILLPCLDR